MQLPSSLQNLIREFTRLPGIGPKTSERLVFSLFQRPKSQIQALINALALFNQEIYLCKQCFNFTNNNLQSSLCQICADPKRDQSTICVVADSLDLIAIESTGYQGLYHILGGVVNPLKGIKIEDLKINELIKRLDNVKEIILAFDPNQEGEMTCYYLKMALGNHSTQIKTTRLGRGLPQGGDLDYADEVTLGEALRGRKEM